MTRRKQWGLQLLFWIPLIPALTLRLFADTIIKSASSTI